MNMTPQEFRKARKDMGLTQAALGLKLGKQARTIRLWEAGEVKVPVAVALAMVTLFPGLRRNT